MKQTAIFALLCLLLIGPAQADTRNITLSVPGMSCPVCPITVRKALEKVDGVIRAKVDYDSRRAEVTFDDRKTDVEALLQATDDAGYPARPLEPNPS